jgi:hypothetical protein
MLVADELEMAQAITQIGSIEPKKCRRSVAERYDVSITTAGYEQVYRLVGDKDRRGLVSSTSEAVLLS